MNSTELSIINVTTGLVWFSIPVAMLVYALRKKKIISDMAGSEGGGTCARRFNWWDIIICVCVLFFVWILSLLLVNDDPSINPLIYAGEKGGVNVVQTVVIMGIGIVFELFLAVPIVLRLCRDRTRQGTGWNFPGWVWVKRCAMAAVAVTAVVFVFEYGTGYAKFCEEKFNSTADMLPFVKGLLKVSWKWSIVAFVCITILGPVFEEILFRAYLYPILKERTGVIFAVVTTTLMFALCHLNLGGFPAYVIFGLAMIWIYEKSRSIWAPIMLHGMINAIVFGMTFGEALFFSK